MATILGEEYVCYSESSSSGHYTPLIAIVKYDGSISFRDVVKEDLARIADDAVFPGTWLFRQTISSTGSWVKRFAILRGEFIFLFHSPANAKPIAIIPLAGTRLLTPAGTDKTFDEQRHAKANDGYEFDIRHTSRPTIRLYALTEGERSEWVSTITQRAAKDSMLFDFNESITRALPRGSNITVTSTKLTGLLLSGEAVDLSKASSASAGPAPAAGVAAPGTASSASPMSSRSGPFQPPAVLSESDDQVRGLHALASSMLSPGTGTGSGSAASIPAAAAHAHGPEPILSVAPQEHGKDKVLSKRNKLAAAGGGGGLPMERYADLEAKLSAIVENHRQARQRQDVMMAKLMSKEYLSAARQQEADSGLPPLTLSDLFRLGLLFFDEELAEDPQPDSMQQFPHVKGAASEAMLLAVYQRYCDRDSGFMSLEHLIAFLEDSAVLQTHAVHDDNDDPLEEFKSALDPLRLVYAVPRMNAGNGSSSFYNEDLATSSYYNLSGPPAASSSAAPSASSDRFTVGFGQFYQILLHITAIVYPSLYAEDSTVAFNKILLEVLLPLFAWGKHTKAGCMHGDPLVAEERIALVLISYCPNLWKVYLTYATDALGRVYEVSTPLEVAQTNEQAMYHPMPLLPDHAALSLASPSSASALGDSLLMSESAVLRFTRDYGLTPYLLSVADARAHFAAVNRSKVIVSSRLPTREQGNATTKAAAAAAKRSPTGTTPMHFGARRDTRFGTRMESSRSPSAAGGAEDLPPPPPPLPSGPLTSSLSGLSFSEFVELIARIAVQNMAQPNYHVVFPTPFSKVLAILTVWGVADLHKLEEVRAIRTDEAY